MKIVKPYGRSIIIGENETIKRQIEKTPEGKREDIDSLLKDEKLIIAQWIGAIDKIIPKPSKDSRNHRQTRGSDDAAARKKLREILGEAAWQHLIKKSGFSGSKEMKELWDWKIYAEQKYRARHEKGRRYQSFVGDNELTTENISAHAKDIIANIERHLNEKQLPIGEDAYPKNEGYKCGMSVYRAKAITDNVLKPQPAPEPQISAELRKIYQCKVPELADSIRQKVCRAVADNNNRESLYQIAVIELKAAWPKLFGKSKEGDALKKAQAEHKELFESYCAIKEVYKKLLKGRRQVRGKLHNILPRNNAVLFTLLRACSENRHINHLIRLGKVLHYTAAETEDGEQRQADNTGFIFKNWAFAAENMNNSRFWRSAGQTEIKQNEALVRVWRRSLAFAARSFKDWVDPANKYAKDILSKRTFDDLDSETFCRKYYLLYGSEWSFKKITREKFAEFVCSGLDALRNAVFHFKGLKKLIENFSVADETPDEIQSEYLKAKANLRAQTLTVMEGAHFAELFTPPQLEHFLEQYQAAETSLLALPGFAKFLKRAHGSGQMPYSEAGERSGESKAARRKTCQYKALNMLYDKPFKTWLEQLKPDDKFKSYIKEAIDRANEGAKHNAKDNGEKEEYLRFWTEKRDTLSKELTEVLQGEKYQDKTAIEKVLFTLQRKIAEAIPPREHYDASGKEAETQCAYVEKFKQDMLSFAFRDYVRGEGFAFLLENMVKNSVLTQQGEESRRDSAQTWLKEQLKEARDNADSIAEKGLPKDENLAWQAKLYCLLHLMPVEEAGNLRHQLLRWQIAVKSFAEQHEGRDFGAEFIMPLIEVFEVYNSLHDAQYNNFDAGGSRKIAGEDIERYIKPYFAPDTDIKEVFPIQKGQENAQAFRGLREFLRFGKVSSETEKESDSGSEKIIQTNPLDFIFKQRLITKEEIQEWKRAEEKIEQYQAWKQILHKRWAAFKDTPSIKLPENKNGDRENTGEKLRSAYQEALKSRYEKEKEFIENLAVFEEKDRDALLGELDKSYRKHEQCQPKENSDAEKLENNYNKYLVQAAGEFAQITLCKFNEFSMKTTSIQWTRFSPHEDWEKVNEQSLSDYKKALKAVYQSGCSIIDTRFIWSEGAVKPHKDYLQSKYKKALEVKVWHHAKPKEGEKQGKPKKPEWVRKDYQKQLDKAFSLSLEEIYRRVNDSVSHHAVLTKRVNLQDHLRLHRLLMAVLGRLIDFSGLFERDLYFVLLALLFKKWSKEKIENDVKAKDEQERNIWLKNCFLKEDKKQRPYKKPNGHGWVFLEKGQIIEALYKIQRIDVKKQIGCLMGITLREPDYTQEVSFSEEVRFTKENDALIGLRNRFAHFAMLENGDLPISLTREVNNARQLMAYDRKLKNAVSQSVKELLEREGLLLTWDMVKDINSHLLQKAKIKPKSIYHLGTKGKKSGEIIEPHCGALYAAMAEALFGEAKTEITAA